jgi:phage shock protein PspC (stress-responsive transcriptional regulator)
MVKQLGRSTAEVIMINTLIPFLFLYGKQTHKSELVSRALAWTEHCEAEHNLIVREWANCGVSAAHAGMSQALIHLKQLYCDEKKCIHCGVGQYMNRLVEYIKARFEQQAFGVCDWWGDKLGIPSADIRIFFVYASFLTIGSPFIIYLIMAFWKKLLSMSGEPKRSSVWDL